MAWYSIRMRAAAGGPHEQGGKHISGAEALIPETEIEEHLLRIWRKARMHSRGIIDFCQLTIEKIQTEIVEVPVLPVWLYNSDCTEMARKIAIDLLQQQGITTAQIELAFELLTNPPENLSGAWLLAADTGRIIAKNVRATRFGWNEYTKIALERLLATYNLKNNRLQEALALATKVNSCPYIRAELCWSDNPEYTTGYVASSALGYRRLPNFKPAGQGGGRVFWIENEGLLDPVLDWLRNYPCLIGGTPVLKRKDDAGDVVL